MLAGGPSSSITRRLGWIGLIIGPRGNAECAVSLRQSSPPWSTGLSWRGSGAAVPESRVGVTDAGTDHSLLSISSLPSDPLAALARITQSEAQLERLRCDLVKKARTQGYAWECIADVLGTSRQAAWEYYTQRFRGEFEENVAENSAVTSREALELSVGESRAVRQRRRSH